MWYRHKDTQADQRNRIEDAVINPHRCGEKIFNRGAKTTQCGKDTFANKLCVEKTGYPHAGE